MTSSTKTPSNSAAWTVATGKPLEVASSPFPTTCNPDEIIVKTRALAINPIDYILRDSGPQRVFPHLKFPYILGYDVAGEVIGVGSSITRFKVGDRVFGIPRGTDKSVNDTSRGGFQQYTILPGRLSAHIADHVSFEEASVLPLAMTTSACALFEHDQLALDYPTLDSKPTGKTLLIWGGSTSVGCCAIQQAVSAGYEVISTCSAHNADLVRSLGASQTFDYRDSDVVAKITKAFKGKTSAGAIAIGSTAPVKCVEVMSQVKGNKFVSLVSLPGPSSPPKRFPMLQTIFYMLTGFISIICKARLGGVNWRFVLSGNIYDSPVGKAVWTDYLHEAMTERKFVALPEPAVVGHGLEAVNGALEKLKAGVSAKKLVVTVN